ncbi:hypothetical protein GMOD_00007693 [Pyrenophora seminiperda CCB06]|uniref:Uncharacterized protein n=1 Tax=Pyrenophora seminiperda CCB06 TaxID=1302712 RepID=A0A3M7MDY4_9PLEO|nr:hypothetical protein GMOD_00007693 [Pyrenophora seminiperda CCB06]
MSPHYPIRLPNSCPQAIQMPRRHSLDNTIPLMLPSPYAPAIYFEDDSYLTFGEGEIGPPPGWVRYEELGGCYGEEHVNEGEGEGEDENEEDMVNKEERIIQSEVQGDEEQIMINEYGYNERYDEGYGDGYEEGYEEGYGKGYDEGYRNAKREVSTTPPTSVSDSDP